MKRFVALGPAIRNIPALQQEHCSVVEPMADKNDGQTAVSLRVLLHMTCNVDLAALDYEMPRIPGLEIAQRPRAFLGNRKAACE